MAQDLIFTLQSNGPGPTGNVAVDFILSDVPGNGKGYELTILNPSAGTVPGSGRALEQQAVYGGRKLGYQLLSAPGGVLIDANSTSLQPIFSVPASTAGFPIVGCIVASMIVRNPTVSLTTVSIAAGWNANGNNVIATATQTGVNASTAYAIVIPSATNPTVGLPSGSFGIKNTIAQGVASNFTVDVFGYIF